MNEALFTVFGIPVAAAGVNTAAAVAVMILFMSLWLIGRKKKTGEAIFAGQVMNSAGFGLLPAIGVFKALQSMRSGTGANVYEPIPLIRWITVNGSFIPERIETAAVSGCFILICLWLIIRREDLPDNGDLLIIAVCLWATIRLVTENLRNEPKDLIFLSAEGSLAAGMILWSVRRGRRMHCPARTAIEMSAVIICLGMNLITAKGVISTGSAIGDLAVTTGSAILALLLTLSTGGEIRRFIRKDESSM